MKLEETATGCLACAMYAWVDLCGVKVINSAAISMRVLHSRTHVGDYIRSTSATHSSQVREVTELVTPGDGKFQWQGGYGRARPGAGKESQYLRAVCVLESCRMQD